MTAYEVSAQIASHMIALLAAIGLVFIICRAPVQDAADDDKARAHVERQAKSAAQQDTWERLDRDGRRMTAYDRIKK